MFKKVSDNTISNVIDYEKKDTINILFGAESIKSSYKGFDFLIYVDRKWLIPCGSLKTGIPNKERTNEREEKVFRITIINGYTEQ